ncbi:hypothetical protein ACFL9U_06675 [Thermodesulfobacteriota bacterium]
MGRTLITGLTLTSLVFAVVSLMASEDKDNLYGSIKEITYRFQDASVPPEYHRSYTITVDKDRLKITVDSYGDILIEKEYRITKDQFEGLIASLKENNIKRAELGDVDGCPGGTSEIISYSNLSGEIFSGTVYQCEGKDFGNLGGNVKGFAQDIKELVPDIEKLIY